LPISFHSLLTPNPKSRRFQWSYRHREWALLPDAAKCTLSVTGVDLPRMVSVPFASTLPVGRLGERLRDEMRRRRLRRVKKIGAGERVVAVGILRVDAGQVDIHVELRAG
jgi:hypothetical protein